METLLPLMQARYSPALILPARPLKSVVASVPFTPMRTWARMVPTFWSAAVTHLGVWSCGRVSAGAGAGVASGALRAGAGFGVGSARLEEGAKSILPPFVARVMV